ncbi:20202_t:CDS:2, partial [Funneliformis geosporum]
MSNPWDLMYEDFVWIFSHPYEVLVEFGLRNTILAIRLKHVKDDKAPKSEFNLLYWSNWRGILSQIMWFLVTLPVFIFYPLLAMKALERPYGLLWDIVESILQRSFEIDTMSVRQATNYILPMLRDKKTENVRLIAHSQGCIIANLVVKRIYTELSYTKEQGYLSKLSVHTFANISREFRNPDGLINCIEHYANRRDPVAVRGVINNINDKRTIGEIFINDLRNGGKGHLFNSFYSLNLVDYWSARGGESVLLNLPGK